MDRGIIIVNSAGEEFREIIGTSDSNSDKHVTHLRNYLKANGYISENIDEMATYTLFVYSARLGLIAFQVDNPTVVYLPKELSMKQYEWYIQNKKNLKKIRNLMITNIEQTDYLTYYDRSILGGENPFKKFKELMEEKAIYEEKGEENATTIRK